MNSHSETTFNYRWNAWICPPIGLIFNILFIFLVLCKTPKEMRIHSQILLQTGFLDILLILLTFIGQPVLSCQQNITVVFFEGYLIGFIFENDSNLLFIFFLISFVISLFDILGLVVQFLYRYFVLNRDIKITLRQYLGMLFIVFTAILLLCGYSYFMTSIFGKKYEYANEKLLLAGNAPTKFYIRQRYTGENGEFATIFDTLFTLFILLSYATIAFCGWKVAKFVGKNLTGRKKELSKQLNRSLIIMAILPLIFLTVVSITAAIDLWLWAPDILGRQEWMSTMEMSFFLLIHWIPVLTPLVTIFTNTPYRKAVITDQQSGTNFANIFNSNKLILYSFFQLYNDANNQIAKN